MNRARQNDYDAEGHEHVHSHQPHCGGMFQKRVHGVKSQKHWMQQILDLWRYWWKGKRAWTRVLHYHKLQKKKSFQRQDILKNQHKSKLQSAGGARAEWQKTNRARQNEYKAEEHEHMHNDEDHCSGMLQKNPRRKITETSGATDLRLLKILVEMQTSVNEASATTQITLEKPFFEERKY